MADSMTIWQAMFNDKYDVRVIRQSKYLAVLQVWEDDAKLFEDAVPLRTGEPNEDDVEMWKHIVETFFDEAKFGVN